MFAKDSLIWENDQIIKKKIRHKNIFNLWKNLYMEKLTNIRTKCKLFNIYTCEFVQLGISTEFLCMKNIFILKIECL